MKQSEKLNPFGRFCCTIGNLPTSYMLSLTYEEQLIWFCKYLEETVIPAVNNNAEALEELQNLFIELKTYVDNYFDDLDVQDEINHKIDEMARDGSLTNIIKAYVDPIYESFEDDINDEMTDYKNQINARVDTIDTKVNNITGATPLVATSTADMTDTSRIYVNTTDGKWYYYDGDSWEIGGTYQSTGIADNSITPEKTTFVKLDPEYNLFNGEYVDGAITTTATPYTLNRGTFVMSHPGQFNLAIVPITPGQSYSVIIPSTSSAIVYATASTYSLENGFTFNGSVHGKDTPVIHFTAGVNDNYLYVESSNSSQNLFIQIVQGTQSSFTTDDYNYYLKGLNWKTKDVQNYKNLIQSCVMLPGFGLVDNEPKIEYDVATHTLKNYYPFNIVTGRDSDYGQAIRIPAFELQINSFQVLTVNREFLKTATREGSTVILESTDLVVKNYYESVNGYIPLREIMLFWCSRGTKVYSTFGMEVKNKGKNILYLGDSILTQADIPALVGEITTTTTYDCCFPGSVMDKQTPAGFPYEQLGFKYLSQAIATGDFTEQDEAVEALHAEGQLIGNHVELLKSIDFDDIDTVVCLYGTNDFYHGVVSLSEYKQTMKESIERILTVYPHLKFYFLSPIYRTSPLTNGLGLKLTDYVAGEKEICDEVNIPYYDLYHNSNINSLTASYYLKPDGLHPNTTHGKELLADKVSKFISSN